MYACMYVSTRVCIYACMYVCMRVHSCMHTCVCMHAHTRTKNNRSDTALPIIIEGQFRDFQRFSSSKLVLKTVESCFAALNYYGNGSKSQANRLKTAMSKERKGKPSDAQLWRHA